MKINLPKARKAIPLLGWAFGLLCGLLLGAVFFYPEDSKKPSSPPVDPATVAAPPAKDLNSYFASAIAHRDMHKKLNGRWSGDPESTRTLGLNSDRSQPEIDLAAYFSDGLTYSFAHHLLEIWEDPADGEFSSSQWQWEFDQAFPSERFSITKNVESGDHIASPREQETYMVVDDNTLLLEIAALSPTWIVLRRTDPSGPMRRRQESPVTAAPTPSVQPPPTHEQIACDKLIGHWRGEAEATLDFAANQSFAEDNLEYWAKATAESLYTYASNGTVDVRERVDGKVKMTSYHWTLDRLSADGEMLIKHEFVAGENDREEEQWLRWKFVDADTLSLDESLPGIPAMIFRRVSLE